MNNQNKNEFTPEEYIIELSKLAQKAPKGVLSMSFAMISPMVSKHGPFLSAIKGNGKELIGLLIDACIHDKVALEILSNATKSIDAIKSGICGCEKCKTIKKESSNINLN
ncbi:hypothetical protein HZP84_03875 [Elizabethkingia anophelis]|nr:hypothetical protein [Elizabethkingia anophelis]